MRRALDSGKKPIIEQPVRIGNSLYVPDILVPNEVVIEVELRTSSSSVVDALRDLQRYMRVIPNVGGLLVVGQELASHVVAFVETLPDRIGLAWQIETRFEGDGKAREIAPWRFT